MATAPPTEDDVGGWFYGMSQAELVKHVRIAVSQICHNDASAPNLFEDSGDDVSGNGDIICPAAEHVKRWAFDD